MKNFVSVLIAVVMTLSVSSVAFAVDEGAVSEDAAIVLVADQQETPQANSSMGIDKDKIDDVLEDTREHSLKFVDTMHDMLEQVRSFFDALLRALEDFSMKVFNRKR